MKVLFIGVYFNNDLQHKLNLLSSNEGKLFIAAMNYIQLIVEGFKYNYKDITNMQSTRKKILIALWSHSLMSLNRKIWKVLICPKCIPDVMEKF